MRIDPFEEARELETGSRRERELRAGLLAGVGDLWASCAANGRRCLGFDAERHDRDRHSITRDLRGVEPSDLPLALVTRASAAVVVPG